MTRNKRRQGKRRPPAYYLPGDKGEWCRPLCEGDRVVLTTHEPMRGWLEQRAPIVLPPIGATGTIDDVTERIGGLMVRWNTGGSCAVLPACLKKLPQGNT
jgi:hypothetical protein